MLTDTKMKHVLGLSGGRDSAALAVYMRQYQPELDIDYFFTDTGQELPEVYEFLIDLEGFLGKEIIRLNPDRDFSFWLKQYNNFLPSVQQRWCTRKLKLHPFEDWVRGFLDDGQIVYSYVAIRADENYREGYTSKHDNLIVKLPLKEDGYDKEGVNRLLEDAGLGLPKYYEWRSRSGCTFCFFQQKIEWLRLYERHPEAFEHAKSLEKNAMDHGSPFSWSQAETLDEMIQEKRAKEIREDHQRRVERFEAKRKAKRVKDPLRPHKEGEDLDEIYGQGKVCLACHK